MRNYGVRSRTMYIPVTPHEVQMLRNPKRPRSTYRVGRQGEKKKVLFVYLKGSK